MWLFFCGHSQEREINFTSLTTKDGLSSNTINAILKDQYGMVWFATEDGLDKFDGTHFTVYRHNPSDTASLNANEILSLHEDRFGNMWIGTSGGSLSLYDRKKDNFINFPSGRTPKSISNNVIRSICSDYRGTIWLAHFDGVSLLNKDTKLVSTIPTASFGAGASIDLPSKCLSEDSRHRMWIGTQQGLFQYDPGAKSIKRFIHNDQDPTSLVNDNINAIAEDTKGDIWIGTDKGLSRFAKDSNRFVNFLTSNPLQQALVGKQVNAIAVDGEKLWVGTAEGLVILDTRTGGISKLESDQRNIFSLTAKAVKCIYIDRQGIYWLGTVRGGIDKFDRNLNLFNHVRSNVFDAKGLNASIVTSFADGGNGKVFVGTDNKGLSLFDPKTRLFQHYMIRSSKGVHNNNSDGRLSVITMAMSRKKELLIGTEGDGMFIVDPSSGKYRQMTQGTDPQGLNSDLIYCITQMRNGNFLVGSNGKGINVLDQNFKVLRKYTGSPVAANEIKLPINGYIRDIKEDRNNLIWIATHGGGLAVLHPDSGVFDIYNTSNSKLPNDKVFTLLEDSQGNLWAGTFGGGVAMFDATTKDFSIFSEKEGLQNNVAYKLIEDDAGLIWVSTNKGISSIDRKTKKICNYNYHNGLQRNNFVMGAGLKLPNGELFFGGLEGFNFFNPSYLIKNKNIPAVLITGLRISNQAVKASPDGPITDHISLAKEIFLDYKQNFALDYVGLSYTAPQQNKYAYKLEGFDKDWNYVGNASTAYYTNLDPGNYTFQVIACNNDGVWNSKGASVKVHVRPPFWRTIYAYLVYLLLIVAIILYMRYKGIQKMKRKFSLEQKKLFEEQERREAERTHELDSQKIKFLTNLSHEFRTPISLILGPAETLLEQQKDIHSFRQMDMIKRNARRLLNMVNQLLDFRKMEEQELAVHMKEGELVTFAKEVSDSFIDLAERKKMDFVFCSTLPVFHTLFDHDKMERILFNILSNAFKFTLPGGTIRLALEKQEQKEDESCTWIMITVSDTGVGIPEDQKEEIFTLFYQTKTAAAILNQGTGIGLTITKEFVKMHGGSISVESEPGQGTTFTILIPFTPLAAPADEKLLSNNDEPGTDGIPPAFLSGNHSSAPALTEKPTILLVEDNDDFRFYLKDKLQLQHKVFEAVDGKDGWHKALAHHPQLIVSDISMPEINGIDLCRKLKGDKRTCHIPIILLTALTREEDQLKGLMTGANDYITKPFNVDMLNAKIKNLLLLNDTLKNTYTRHIKAITPEITIQSADEELMHKITIYLEENLANPQLSVEELSKHVGMSRSSLYGKLLELTGQTPVEYIRSVKLDKAAILLQKSDMNVTQIAYTVGFSTPNYFAKSFKAKFNLLPSEYITKMRNEGKNNSSD